MITFYSLYVEMFFCVCKLQTTNDIAIYVLANQNPQILKKEIDVNFAFEIRVYLWSDMCFCHQLEQATDGVCMYH